MSDITAAPIPPDGRLQAWRNFGGVLQTRWKDTSDPNSQWTAPWAPFITTGLGGAVAPFVDMTAGNLSDGRTQIWAVDSAGVVWTTWKESTAHDSLWTSWSKFNTANIPAGTVHSIAVAELPDDRLQLFIMDNTNHTWTAWKTTTDPSSAWTGFSAF
jgi:hypothetical protein